MIIFAVLSQTTVNEGQKRKSERKGGRESVERGRERESYWSDPIIIGKDVSILFKPRSYNLFYSLFQSLDYDHTGARSWWHFSRINLSQYIFLVKPDNYFTNLLVVPLTLQHHWLIGESGQIQALTHVHIFFTFFKYLFYNWINYLWCHVICMK